MQHDDLIYIYSEMITPAKIINIIWSCSYHLCVCDERPWIFPLSKFPVFNTLLLTLVIMLYIRSLHLM